MGPSNYLLSTKYARFVPLNTPHWIVGCCGILPVKRAYAFVGYIPPSDIPPQDIPLPEEPPQYIPAEDIIPELEEEQQYIEELLSYQIEGLIVLSHTLSSKQLSSYQIPIVAIEREAEYISSVTTDNYMGALQATTLLIRDKCDILIHINVNVEKTVPAYDRIRAFKETCEEYQVPYDIDLSAVSYTHLTLPTT